ncbi:HNH endonuclease [Brevundimonas sp. BR2-1]|uniref:HNH endonuclease n=1 Tax=Brevundimonas sp. BR2-1 TaxID=3031123 RepID=UPI00309714F1
MVQCILTGDEITPENDSKAHIIPSALGGRLKPKGILCKVANSKLGDQIDQPMIAGMEAIMTLLNGSRDRGENPAIEVEDESGERLVFRFGETLKTAKPEFEYVRSAMLFPAKWKLEVGAMNEDRKEARTGYLVMRVGDMRTPTSSQRASNLEAQSPMTNGIWSGVALESVRSSLRSLGINT